MDWNLLTCGVKGHITYAPDDAEHVTTPSGEAWRCLRCDDYRLGEPDGHGPATAAPQVKRDRELRDAFVMRLLAIERLLRALVILMAAYGVWRFSKHRDSLQSAMEQDLPLLKPFANQIGWNLDHSKIVKWAQEILATNDRAILWISLALAAYAAIELIEAIGLWLLKRWGEYFAVIATAAFLPLEIYELTEKVTPLRLTALLINLFLVVYLIYTKHLFGLRPRHSSQTTE
ncbi:DUF2127 domain-containing protein [Actinocorallia lasiicapitis]